MADGYQQRGRQLVTQASQQMNEQVRVQRSRFTTEWSHLKPFDAGAVYPFFFDEIYPGEHVRYDVQAFVRMGTMLFPQFSQQVLDTHFFFCPTRLLWRNFTKMLGEQDTPGAATDYVVPIVSSAAGGFAVGSLYDHFGIPTVGQVAVGGVTAVNALPLRMYNFVWNSWYRDEDLQVPASLDLSDGPDSNTWYTVLPRSKFADYFTTLRPWPQKFPAPTVPLAGTAWVKGLAFETLANGVPLVGGYESPDDVVTYSESRSAADLYVDIDDSTNYPQIYADLSSATGVSVNALREAVLVQQIYERDARFGTRYIETVKAHFDVVVPDFRLARPEYFGGGSSQLNVSAVAQTATGGGGVAALGGAGVLAGQHTGSYAALEHGYILGLVSIRTEQVYTQGLHPFWQRRNRFDFMYPLTAQFGEQAVTMGTLYHRGNSNDDVVLGYAPRFDELRTRWSEAVGVFRPTAATNIDEWHLGQLLFNPTLNASFIQDSPPVSRVLAAGDTANGQQYLGDFLIRRSIVRPIPMYGRPLSFGAL